MLSKFWESMGEGISGKWLDLLVSPAFIFWGGGLLIVSSQYGFEKTWIALQALTIDKQVALIVIGFLVLSLSSALIMQFRYVILRLLEGYWPWPFRYIGIPIIWFHKWNFNRLQNRWNNLKNQEDNGKLPPSRRREISMLERKLHYYPTNQNDFLPTSLGNAIKVGEDAPYYKYGLDTLVCWPRLWLVLPEKTQTDLSSVRQILDRLIQLLIWGVLFLVWAWWWRWVILISLIWGLFTYALAMQAAMNYSDLIESVFDIHRFELYKAMHWSLPEKSGETEVNFGKQLTEFLWRGTTEKPIKFAHPQE